MSSETIQEGLDADTRQMQSGVNVFLTIIEDNDSAPPDSDRMTETQGSNRPCVVTFGQDTEMGSKSVLNVDTNEGSNRLDVDAEWKNAAMSICRKSAN